MKGEGEFEQIKFKTTGVFLTLAKPKTIYCYLSVLFIYLNCCLEGVGGMSEYHLSSINLIHGAWHVHTKGIPFLLPLPGTANLMIRLG